MSKLPASYKDPKIFNNQYIITSMISSGSFGVVYLAFDKRTKEQYAVKLEKEENEDVATLDREIQVLHRLEGVEGIPHLYWYGREQNFNVIVIDLLGHDLSHYLKLNRRFTVKSILLLADQLITILQKIHDRGIIHRDLKPENIMTGLTDSSKIFLVDFGVSKIFIDQRRKHIPFKEKKSFIGTTRYASIAAHKGHELSRKDDLESLIYELKRKLPWQSLQNIGDKDRTAAVGEVKIATDINNLCRDLPPQFVQILRYVKSLEFNTEPDYEYIKSQIRHAAKENNVQFDRTFDWTEKVIKNSTQESFLLSGVTKDLPRQSLETNNAELRITQEQIILGLQQKSTSIDNPDLKVSNQIIQNQSKEKILQLVSDPKLNLLKPPDPKYQQHSDNKNPSSVSQNPSNFSIMMIYKPSNEINALESSRLPYIPSEQLVKIEVPPQEKRRQSIPTKIKQELYPENFKAIQICEAQHQDLRISQISWGFKPEEMDEYFDDAPRLCDKLWALQQLEIKTFKFFPNNMPKIKNTLNIVSCNK